MKTLDWIAATEERTIAALCALVLVLFALAASPLLAAPVPIGPSASLLIRDTVATETTHAGTTYVQVAIGDEYAVRLTNPYGRRIAVALTVDGLNTIDGREGDARLWVLGPRETATIPGWQVSGATARKFSVSREADSYARKLGAKTRLGVIRAVFHEERVWTSPLTLDTSPGWTPASARLGEVSSGIFVSSPTNTTPTSLGTAMGASTSHDVREVDFERGAEIGAVEIHYVTSTELQAVLRRPRPPVPSPWCPEPERNALRKEIR